MYAVVKTGGKQYRVEENQILQVELLGEIGESINLTPLMYVDGNTVLAKPNELENIEVNAEIVNTAKAKKINGFTYKNKSNQRRRWGHRQNYNEIKITSISRKK
ncbi:MAG: 50S ribosomal protein L21 [Acidimicrobiaceae bacterium]|jgi:large subunit ribosomal protein L21|nr:50S ribosomal protein L21 [Acidimicrobiaceae bacterium]|tara:strand:- start:16806 stop:17117 length:312 start_codon:yes stop_codon:yes gene_type:complete